MQVKGRVYTVFDLLDVRVVMLVSKSREYMFILEDMEEYDLEDGEEVLAKVSTIDNSYVIVMGTRWVTIPAVRVNKLQVITTLI